MPCSPGWGLGANPGPNQAILFQLGGAVADQDTGATAFGNRDADHIFFAAGRWPRTLPTATGTVSGLDPPGRRSAPTSTGGNYVNVQTADEDDNRTGEAYRENLDRLARIKAAYDQENLFRVNRNIPPAE